MKLSASYLALLTFGMTAFLAPAYSQLTITPSLSAATLAAKLAGPGITILSPTLTCPTVANGSFVSVSTPLAIDSGIVLTTGKAINTAGLESFLASTNDAAPGDPALAGLALTTTLYDACTLEFNFIPKGDTVSFNYQFGSEEYNHSTCGPYNDAFAFFISGPGITGTQNMALIPGTTIPVTVNSVNSGIPGTGYTLANCMAMGPGSPFTSYFYDNTGGTQLTYKGYTTKLRAYHSVAPCDTYHLKISICDAGNKLYDSGVFIEAGSLKTNSISFNHADSIGATIAGLPHTIVKGCSPATIAVVSSHILTTNQTVHFTFGGTAIHGTDYAAPDSATLLAGSDSIVISLSGIATPPSGIKTLTVYLSSPYTCGITDSININLLDSPFVGILTPDTTICSGNSFQIRATASPFLTYTWSPASSLSSATILQPIASPVATTTYTLTSSLPGSGCPAITKNITVIVINTSISVPVPTATICTGGSTPLSVTGSPTLNYSWSPSTGLSNPNIQNPTASPTVTTTYTVTATGPGGICPSSATVTVIVGSLAISVLTPDTTICLGSGFDIRAAGTSGATYSWTPSIGLSSPSILNPTATPSATTTYSLNATWPGSGCPDYNYSFTVSVLDARIAMLSADTSFCIGGYDNIQLEGQSGLQYSWTPATGLDNPFIQNPVATPSVTTLYTVTATTPGGLCSNSATIRIAVANPDVAIDFSDSTICLGSSLAMPVKGSKELTYLWTPALGLTNPNISDPIASPAATTVYTLSVSDPGSLCTITTTVKIEVIDAVLTNVSLDQTIKYGSSVQLNADNAKFYFWTPDDGSLNNANINNPIATPTTPTTYIINGIDKYGCRATDSVRIDLTYDDVFIPGAFSPNNDGLNDIFRVGNLGYYKLVNMNVYNRWGTLIYHSGDGNNKAWDGTFEGTKQDLGVYNYYIILMNPKGEQKTFKGNVTLIR